MAILSIDSKLGYIEVDGTRKLANEATVEDIECLIRAVMEQGSVEMDEVSEIVNPANKIVYEQLYEALSGLVDRKEGILAEVEGRFAEAEKKYLK